MSLTFVEPSAFPAWLNILLYGPEGSGKTYGALSAPDPILYAGSEGSNAVADARAHFGAKTIREVAVTSPHVLDEIELYLREGGNGEKSLVLDSLSSIYQALVDFHSGGGKPTLPNYGDASLRIERFCRFARDLPMTVVAIAHELSVKDDALGGIERMPSTGSSNPALGVKIAAMYDVVAYTARVEPTEAVPETRWLAQTIALNSRRGKNRGDFLPPFVPVDVTAWLRLKQQHANRPAHTDAAPSTMAVAA